MNSVSAPKIPLDAFDSSRCSVPYPWPVAGRWRADDTAGRQLFGLAACLRAFAVVAFTHVKSHEGNAWNEVVDVFATAVAAG